MESVTLPAHIELALREIGVVAPAKVPLQPLVQRPTPMTGIWYRNGEEVPF